MERERICNACNKKYNDNLDNKFSTDIRDYCKYLGSCNQKCFYTLPLHKRNHLFMSAIYRDQKNKLDKNI